MNPIRRWLNGRSLRRQAQVSELRDRLDVLVASLQDRLDQSSYSLISEWAGNAEPELSIDAIWEQVDGGSTLMSPAERQELEALTNHPGLDTSFLSAGRRHLTRDIRRR
jgi:hypothetical protein